MIFGDLGALAGAFRARKRPLRVRVEFAEQAGELATREGPVRYAPGDALLTGIDGERWPIPQASFAEHYGPCAPTPAGVAGWYVKRPITVWAWRADRSLDVELSAGRGTLHAEPGDVVVQYAPDDLAVVGAGIFQQTYDMLEEPTVGAPQR